MHWEVVSASAAVIVPVASLLWYFNGLRTRGIVREDNDRLLTLINGTYLRSAGSKITGYDIERRLDWLEDQATALPPHRPHRREE